MKKLTISLLAASVVFGAGAVQASKITLNNARYYDMAVVQTPELKASLLSELKERLKSSPSVKRSCYEEMGNKWVLKDLDGNGDNLNVQITCAAPVRGKSQPVDMDLRLGAFPEGDWKGDYLIYSADTTNFLYRAPGHKEATYVGGVGAV